MAGKPFTMPPSVTVLLEQGFNTDLINKDVEDSAMVPSTPGYLGSPASGPAINPSPHHTAPAFGKLAGSIPAVVSTSASFRRVQAGLTSFRDPQRTESSNSFSDTAGIAPPSSLVPPPLSSTKLKPRAASGAHQDFSSSLHITDEELVMVMFHQKGKGVLREAVETEVPKISNIDVKPALPPARVTYTRVGVTPCPVAALAEGVSHLEITRPVSTDDQLPPILSVQWILDL